MPLTTQLETIFVEASVPDAFKQWLAHIGILTVGGVVFAANSDRALVDSEIIIPSQLGLTVQAKVAVRKAWSVVAALLTHQEANARAIMTAPDNAPIGEHEARNLHEVFFQRHDFRLPAKRLLADELQTTPVFLFTEKV